STGPDNIPKAGQLAREAAASGDVTRPPVEFTAGWFAIVGWLLGIVGFASTWVAAVVKKPAIAILVPLPVAAFAGISVPENAQVPSGIVVLVLFALGLGLLSSARQYEEGARVPLSYELRKLARAMPLIGGITIALIVLSQTSFLFPDPQIDPAEEPQKPKTVPITEVEDRPLFEVRNPEGGPLVISGPWRMGSLDVYDGRDWRLPAFNDQRLADLPDDGIVDRDLFLRRGIQAEFKVLGLGGAALPTLPNSVAIQAQGPKLEYDPVTGTFRVASAQAPSGLRYKVAAASLPEIEELRANTEPVPPEIEPYLEIPDPPPAVRTLLEEAASKYSNAWDRFDFLRNHVLDEVTAAGPGQPVSITPDRAQEILGDTLEASPFEIVALQAMLARWTGVPSRIGYGFDGGEKVGDLLVIRPVHGASFVEVWFPGFKWLPVIGTPKQAKPTVGSDPSLQNLDPEILPSDDIAVQVYLPVLLDPPSQFADLVKRALLVALVAAFVVGGLYVGIPAGRKARTRARRRTAARRHGPRARIALAYAEWRDHAADHGYRWHTDTPLRFQERFVDDPEHTELAWLTTRALWGDLRDGCDDELASHAEELSRALRRRLSQAQPATMRFVAGVSRVSLRDPFAPASDLTEVRARGGLRRRRNGHIDVTPPVTNGHRAHDHQNQDEEEDDRVPAPV
ncbi:MAG: transglutaminaseTgpA domain-containing protein, partial [Acidimicrobiales bacterium]